MKIRRLFLLSVLLFFSLPVSSKGLHWASADEQKPDTCLATVNAILALSSRVCQNLERGHACYASGPLQGTTWAGEAKTLTIAGEQPDVADIHTLQLGGLDEANNAWGFATLRIQGNLEDDQTQRNITLVLFGDAQIENIVPAPKAIKVTTTGNAILRARPKNDAAIVERLSLREVLTANGRLKDSTWLRVSVPDSGQSGWVSAKIVQAGGDIRSLDVIDPDAPFYRPMQAFKLQTAESDAPCPGAPSSGLIIQAPNIKTPVELVINGVQLRLTATAFIQAAPGENMIINVLDGYAEVEANASKQIVPAGARLQVPLDENLMPSGDIPSAEPYDTADLQSLPLNDLERRVTVRPPLTPEGIVEALRNPTGETTVTVSQQYCRLKASGKTNLRGGPGTYFEVIGELRAGDTVYPVYQTQDADKNTWWQLYSGGWVRSDFIRPVGECGQIPYIEYVNRPPQTNVLHLDGCTTDNGPLRNGQYVQITFSVGGWASYAEAEQAFGIDPGKITLNNRPLRLRYSAIERVAPERYYRTIIGRWKAKGGSYHIVGERQHVVFSCDLTIPFAAN
jgi:uncharacterized protein YraI